MSVLESAGGVTLTRVNSATTTTPRALTTGKKQRLLAAHLIASGTGTVQLANSATDVAISEAYAVTTSQPFSFSFCPCGHIETAASSALKLVLGGGISVVGHFVIQTVN